METQIEGTDTEKAGEADVNVHSTGSNFFLVAARTNRAQSWVEENVSAETWYGESFVCEHRYVEDMVCGMIGDGLGVTKDNQALCIKDGTVMMNLE